MWIVGAIAHCSDCDKEWQSRNAKELASKHHRKMGHSVNGEVTYAFAFKNPRPPAGGQEK